MPVFLNTHLILIHIRFPDLETILRNRFRPITFRRLEVIFHLRALRISNSTVRARVYAPSISITQLDLLRSLLHRNLFGRQMAKHGRWGKGS